MNSYIPKSFYEKDKQQHFLVSAAIFTFLSFVTNNLSFSLIATLYLGLLKETWDHYAGSGFCWKDMIANILGTISSLLLSITLELAL